MVGWFGGQCSLPRVAHDLSTSSGCSALCQGASLWTSGADISMAMGNTHIKGSDSQLSTLGACAWRFEGSSGTLIRTSFVMAGADVLREPAATCFNDLHISDTNLPCNKPRRCCQPTGFSILRSQARSHSGCIVCSKNASRSTKRALHAHLHRKQGSCTRQGQTKF